jgi:hypothetical protein
VTSQNGPQLLVSKKCDLAASKASGLAFIVLTSLYYESEFKASAKAIQGFSGFIVLRGRMMVRSSARVDVGIQDIGIVLFIRWRSRPSGTGPRQCRRAARMGSERSHSRVQLPNNSDVRKKFPQGSCGNAGVTARASDAIFRASRGLTQPDRNQWLSRIDELLGW